MADLNDLDRIVMIVQPVRNCEGTRAELSPLSNSYFFFWSLKEMMEPTLPLGADVWDLDRLGLPADRVGNLETRRRPPRHWPGDPFIKGPIPYAWIASACRLPGSGIRVAMACRFLCCRFRSENRWGLDAIAKGLRITSRSARRGLYSAELSGLLAVEREPGCKLVVSVPECRKLEAGSGRRPLYGPIPWSWWLPASRLPGRSLQVASVCWLLAVGAGRRILSWRWTVGPSSASHGSRPPGAWMSWSGTDWSPLVGRQTGLRMLQSWTPGQGRISVQSESGHEN
jgi:hypothetical protein